LWAGAVAVRKERAMDTVSKIGNGKAAKRIPDSRPRDDSRVLVDLHKREQEMEGKIAECRKKLDEIHRDRDVIVGRWMAGLGERACLEGDGARFYRVSFSRTVMGPVATVELLEESWRLPDEYPAPDPDDDWDDDTRVGLTAMGWATAIPPTANTATE
jgi:hypothetical protein